MYKRDEKLFLQDILDSTKAILEFTNGLNVDEFSSNRLVYSATIREFEIIGEASKYLLKDAFLAKEYQEVVDFRNQITHEYFGIDQNVVWAIIHKDLDTFEETIIDLINSIERELRKELIEAFKEDNRYLDFVIEALEKLND